MKVIAWNLAHQVKKRPIPDYLVDVILDLEADTVLFNEYVDDEIRLPIDWIRGHFLAGEKIKNPISDYAVLRSEV